MSFRGRLSSVHRIFVLSVGLAGARFLVARFLHHGDGLYAHVFAGLNSLHEIDGIVAACPPHVGTNDRDLCPEETRHTGHHPALALFQYLGVLPAAADHHPQEVDVLTVAAIQLPHQKIVRVAIRGSPRWSGTSGGKSPA